MTEIDKRIEKVGAQVIFIKQNRMIRSSGMSYLEVSELCELLSTLLQLADVWF